MDYVLTWNCMHIANARLLPKVRSVLMELDCLAIDRAALAAAANHRG